MDKEHFPGQEVQRTHTATCLISTSPIVNFVQDRQITMNKLLSGKVNCVNKIYDYKYIQIFHFIQRANKWENTLQKHREIREYTKKESTKVIPDADYGNSLQ